MKKAAALCLSVCLLCLPLFIEPARAAGSTADQKNIVGWSDYYYDVTWTALKTIPGWNGKAGNTFYEGSSYHIPYAQPINSGKYINYGVSVDAFLAAANDVDSEFYAKTSSYLDNTSTYYGMDCSAFVSSFWGIKRTTTYYIPTVSENLGSVSEDNIDQICPGDALNSRSAGHVVLVTDIAYSDGAIEYVEITEETPPQLKRTTYTRPQLIKKYSEYTIQRYTGSVPVPPEGYAPEDHPLLGDADTDTQITILDATAIQRRLASINVPVFDETAADADEDGEVTIIDATAIQRHLAGLKANENIGKAIG